MGAEVTRSGRLFQMRETAVGKTRYFRWFRSILVNHKSQFLKKQAAQKSVNSTTIQIKCRPAGTIPFSSRPGLNLVFK